jgi:hypothetical protein
MIATSDSTRRVLGGLIDRQAPVAARISAREEVSYVR